MERNESNRPVHFTNSAEFTPRATGSRGEKSKYNCRKKNPPNEKKKRKYFPIERRGRPNIRISHVSIRALHAAITNNIIIKNSLKQYRRIR